MKLALLRSLPHPKHGLLRVGVISIALATAGCGSGGSSGGPSAAGGSAATLTGSEGGSTNGSTSTSSGSGMGGSSTVSSNTSSTTSVAGSTAAGGTGAVAGNGGAGGTDMRDMSSSEIVEDMHLGWNLGNTLDADPDETAWGNPRTTQAMMDAVQAAGFNTVRIPVTWEHHMGGPPNYQVDDDWMNRVEEVVGYVLSTGMYAIVNSHHDEWVSLMPFADHDAVTEQLTSLWTQIATRFRDYDDYLIFETLNEPRTRDSTEWSGGTPEARQILNGYNLAAVNAIRATGGNNMVRHIMVPTHAANPSTTTIEDLVIPNDDPRIIVSLHTYYPNEFSMGNESAWGSDADRSDMADELDRIYDLLPANGRAVVIGEWGSINKNNTSARVDHAETYARLVRERGMCSIWWDNGAAAPGSDGFGILDRDGFPPDWSFPEIAAALADGAEAGAGL